MKNCYNTAVFCTPAGLRCGYSPLATCIWACWTYPWSVHIITTLPQRHANQRCTGTLKVHTWPGTYVPVSAP